LAQAGISAVVDATHPFAARITARTAAVCRDLGMPYLRLERPGWVPGPGDDWVMVEREADVVRYVGPEDVVFLGTGRQTLERFAGLGVSRVYCRVIDPPKRAFPFAGGEFVVGRPPFSVDDEVALFARLGVTRLVVKNAGGELSRSKLEAARRLGIQVVMLARPVGPVCARVETVEEAVGWAGARLAGGGGV
jgi:precorrin-6A/cobalt-precorrin-6A reductase